MIMTMIRPETEMKDSGVQWLGNVPKEWSVGKVKHEFYATKTIVGDKVNDYERLALTLNGVIKRSKDADDGLQPEKFDGYQILKEHELVFKLIDLANVSTSRVGLSPYTGIVSPAYIVLHHRKDMNPRYGEYYFLSMWMNEVFNHIGGDGVRSALKAKDLLNIPYLKVSSDEQQAIADYLDETCSKIDEIIAEAKASIDEYEKLKQATIDENIFGYDSVHIKLRQLGSLKNGLNFSHSDDVANIKFLGVGCFKDNMILSEVDDFADEHIDFEISEEYLLSDGDIVFVRSNGSKELVGRSIMVENIDYPVTFSGFCIRFRNMHTELVDNRFLLYYFRTTHFKQSLLKYSNDSTNINNLNQEMLNAIRINAPVIAEQKLLVKKMAEQVFAFDSLIAEKESLINDLEAYKKSLIYEVVTGKRRVV